MKTAVFDTHIYDRTALEEANTHYEHDLQFFETRLMDKTAKLAAGFPAICAFVNDRLDRSTLTQLKEGGTELIALRSAGFNHIDLIAAAELGLRVTRVPEYSPYAVAEHTVALILTLNRKIHRAYNRVREFNFSLDGLLGFDLRGKTVGVIGTGRIGRAFAQIMHGFGCKLLAYDLDPKTDWADTIRIEYVPLHEVLQRADIVSLHLPLTPETRHMIDAEAFGCMKPGSMLVNTSRGALIDSKALLSALKTRSIGSAGLDVYEEEEGIFFHDLSEYGVNDDVLARLLTFPNVLITSHQAFLTREALAKIAETTLESIREFEQGRVLANELHPDFPKPKGP